MKTASVRELRQNFARIQAWLQAGEKVAITLRRQAIATLVPRPQKKRAQRSMPNLTSRLKRVFGEQVISRKTMKSILDQNRGTV
jgi:antitoxin (DNA-binding transcriptional repressor) of toxin-antitoxin stability system